MENTIRYMVELVTDEQGSWFAQVTSYFKIGESSQCTKTAETWIGAFEMARNLIAEKRKAK